MKIKFYLFIIILHFNNFTFSEKLSEYNSPTILLTGAAGFIGSNFLEYMFDKYTTYKFIVLDKLTYAGNLENIPDRIKKSNRFKFYYGSVTNQNLVNILMAKANYVVHFAAESHVTNSIYEDDVFFDTDVNGTRILMRALTQNKNRIKRFIHISTSEVYGTALTEPINEDHLLNPTTPYAAAKAGADRLVYSYMCTYNIPAVIIRPFNNYGPRQHLEKVIPWFITRAIAGEDLTVHGNGNQTRDWTHVKDTCKALDTALHIKDFQKIKNQIINIGTGKKISINEIAKKILNYFNLPKEKIINMADRPGQVDCHISSTNKAKELLEWEATISFDEGLRETIEWYKNNQNWWKNTIIVAKYMKKSINQLRYKKG